MKKINKFLSFICLMLAMLGMFSYSANANGNLSGVFRCYTVNEANSYKAISRGIAEDITATGKLYATFPVMQEESAALVMALYNSDGTLASVQLEQKAAGESERTLSATHNVSNGQKTRCFVIDSTSGMLPMNGNSDDIIDVTYQDAHSVVLTWSEDAFPDAEKYLINRDGTFIGECFGNRITESYLVSDKPYTYTILPVVNGTVQNGISQTVVISPFIETVLGANGYSKNMNFVSGAGDSQTQDAEYAGRECREILQKSGGTTATMMYFATSKSMIPSIDNTAITFEVTYFDEGEGDIFVAYNTASVLAKKQVIAKLTDSGEWKTVRKTVTDACFRAPAELRSCDFRVGGPVGTHFSKVVVDKIEYMSASKKDYSSVYLDFAPAYADLSNLEYPETGNLTDITVPTTIDGGDWAFWVSDGVMHDNDKNATVTLDINPEYAQTITITYNTSDGIKTKEVNVANKSRHLVILENALLAQGATAADVTISAVAADGVKNNPLAVEFVSFGALVPQYATLDFTNGTIDANGIWLREGAAGNDGYNYATTYGGRKCRLIPIRTENGSNTARFMYLDLDDRIAYHDKDEEIVIEIDYYDEAYSTTAPGELKITYGTDSGAYGKTLARGKLGSHGGGWRTDKATMSGTRFTAAMNGGTDLRITSETKNTQMYVSGVRMYVTKTTSPNRVAPQIFLAGDSTCEPLPENYYPREGWGMEIGQYFTSDVTVVNKAKGGKSARSFLNGVDCTADPVNYNDDRMGDILLSANPGDFLFIQFGHNDDNNSTPIREQYQYNDPDSLIQDETAYRYNLKRFVNICDEYGIIPVFLTSIYTRTFNADKTLDGSNIDPYRNAMRAVAKEMGVTLLDVSQMHKELVEAYGEELSTQLFCHFDRTEYPNTTTSISNADNTHLSAFGANEVAKIVINAIMNAADDGDANMQRLEAFIDKTINTHPIYPDVEIPENETLQIFLAGDSTCEPLPENYYPREGWGMEIGQYFTSDVTVVNKAKGGKSARSFLNGVDCTAKDPLNTPDDRMSAIIEAANPGDFLFIQFGHNDDNKANDIRLNYQYNDPDNGLYDDNCYRYNLEKFITICKKHQIIPVFLTSIRTRNFNGTELTDAGNIEPYREVMRDVAANNNVALIEVAKTHEVLVEKWGPDLSTKLYCHFDRADYPDAPTSISDADNTHLSAFGANEVAKIIVSKLIEGAEAGDTRLQRLSKFIDTDKDLTMSLPND